MKERILYDDEFEKQLKEKSDQLKMYPSDKVWNQVYSNLHTRRRRFVAGMTLLIGSILILAGSVLISPSKNTHPATLTTKTDGLMKTAAAKDNPAFPASSFTAPDKENMNDEPVSAVSLNPSSPFNFYSLAPSETKAASGEKLESYPETIQSITRVKPIQPTDAHVSEKTVASAEVDVLALDDFEQTLPENASTNNVSAELSPENSVTQLTHNRNDRFSWEIYVTPTLNTHYLTGINYQTMVPAFQSAPIMVVHIANANGFVDNTPVLGFNVGGNIMYRISKNISLKAGVEFSYNRYYIKAYNSNNAQSSAALNSYLGYVADSLQNPNGGFSINKNPQHYQNRYYQLSVPVGVDMKVAGKGKVQLHVGATLQPSYLLNTDAYVLSDDYSNYTKDPQAFRRWNLNVGGEVYVSYAVGKLRWEIGPQVRYQLFSTYKNSYPLKENMLNYGIRIGISKTIR